MAALLELLRWPAFTNDDEVGQGTEGRFGIPRFNGEPTRLAEYSFRVRARAAKEKAMSKDERDKLGPLELRLVEGLSGTALRMVQNMDMSELSKENGVNTLLEIFEKTLRPKRLQQARELYAAGAATHGIMARQPTEPMATYVLRRRTWYRCLTDCSEDMKLPDLVLAEQLLACSNLSTDHQLLVRTALKGEVTFDAVADELVAQHGRTHERERRAHHKGGGAKHGNRGWTTTTRSWRPSGYMADGNYDTTEDYEDVEHTDDGYPEDFTPLLRTRPPSRRSRLATWSTTEWTLTTRTLPSLRPACCRWNKKRILREKVLRRKAASDRHRRDNSLSPGL